MLPVTAAQWVTMGRVMRAFVAIAVLALIVAVAAWFVGIYVATVLRLIFAGWRLVWLL